MMSRCVLVLVFGIFFQLSHGIEFNVTKDGKLCLYADLKVTFSITYEDLDNKTQEAVFDLTDATSDGSTCDAGHSVLMLKFGEGHSCSMSFSKNGEIYNWDLITLTYNLGDPVHFPNSKSKDHTLSTGFPDIKNIGMDTCYSCRSEALIDGGVVKMMLRDVLIQAFISDGNKSSEISSCPADQSITSTTAGPDTTTTTGPTTNATTTTGPTTTTNATTTTGPTTNATTTTGPTTTTNATTTTGPTNATTTTGPTTTTNATTTTAPNTTTTTAPITTPVPTLPVPSTGNYSIKAENSTACLLANFGLRLGIKQGEEINLDPSVVIVSGLCGVNSSELTLASKVMTIKFTFTNDTKKFRLHALNINVTAHSGNFSVENSSLNLWEASIGTSYMCNKEQTFNISNITIYTFSLHVQPFAVNKGVFSTAHECSMDDTSILVPIIVGAALAGLILIVVIAYVIGRRKTYVGYQTL